MAPTTPSAFPVSVLDDFSSSARFCPQGNFISDSDQHDRSQNMSAEGMEMDGLDRETDGPDAATKHHQEEKEKEPVRESTLQNSQISVESSTKESSVKASTPGTFPSGPTSTQSIESKQMAVGGPFFSSMRALEANNSPYAMSYMRAGIFSPKTSLEPSANESRQQTLSCMLEEGATERFGVAAKTLWNMSKVSPTLPSVAIAATDHEWQDIHSPRFPRCR